MVVGLGWVIVELFMIRLVINVVVDISKRVVIIIRFKKLLRIFIFCIFVFCFRFLIIRLYRMDILCFVI